ncbi:MAG: glucoamylase family protein [Acidimicrobiia bacterium]
MQGNSQPGANEELLARVQRTTFEYFLDQVNPANGLIADKNKPGWPASIAAVGLALTAYPIAVERAYVERLEAVERTLTTLRFFAGSRQGREPDATGYNGFFYHWLDMETGRRAWKCELSTVDSALLFAGALAASAYFDHDTAEEAEIRDIADRLYRAADWQWAQNGEITLTHGWKPESGFLPHRWRGYDEAVLLYVLGLGSPTFPLPPESYEAFTSTYKWKTIYDVDVLYAGPLFIHQLSHVWIDFEGIQDAPMREHGIDYFENSRRATYLQQQYAIRNPQEYPFYSERCWGITASDGPGPNARLIDGIERVFFDYIARGAPYGPDDGTIAPWGVVASLPFAPEIVLPTLRYFSEEVDLEQADSYGFKATFNPCFPVEDGDPVGWVSPWNFGLNQGPIVMMIENYRNGFVWKQMRNCGYLVKGLRAGGFRGGWLE